MKNKRKKTTKLIAIALILAAIYLFIGVAQQIYSALNLKKQKAIIAKELARLKSENENLNENKKKFLDPNYVITYARGAYMFSKDDEKIFYLPGGDKIDNEENNNANGEQEKKPDTNKSESEAKN